MVKAEQVIEVMSRGPQESPPTTRHTRASVPILFGFAQVEEHIVCIIEGHKLTMSPLLRYMQRFIDMHDGEISHPTSKFS